MQTTAIKTLGELKAALKMATAVMVWVQWQTDDGDYIEIPKTKFLRGIGADTPFDPSGHGGRPDWTPVKAEMRGTEVYIN